MGAVSILQDATIEVLLGDEEKRQLGSYLLKHGARPGQLTDGESKKAELPEKSVSEDMANAQDAGQDPAEPLSETSAVHALLRGLRKCIRTFALLLSFGITTEQLLRIIERIPLQALKSKKLPHVPIRAVAQLASFFSLLISIKQPLSMLLNRAIKIRSQQSQVASAVLVNALVSALAVSCYPKSILMNYAGWYYLFFGVDYSYKLFEQKQIQALKEKRPRFTSLFRAVTQKSWVLFAICSTFTWQFYITEPTRAHGLPSQFFDRMGKALSLGARIGAENSDGIIDVLRSAYRTKHRVSPGLYLRVLGAVPHGLVAMAKTACLMILAKSVIQFGGEKNDDKVRPWKIARRRIPEITKLAAFLTGVPASAFVLTSYLSQRGPLTKSKLRLVGFLCGLLAVIYRGQARELDKEDSGEVLTNRDAWINMSREVVIASLTMQPYQTRLSRIALAAGLSTVMSIYDYEKLSGSGQTVLADAKFLRFLGRVSE